MVSADSSIVSVNSASVNSVESNKSGDSVDTFVISGGTVGMMKELWP